MSQEIAKTILSQLGGNMFRMMTGAKDFTTYGNGALGFRIGRNAKSVNFVRITLNAMDTYDCEFLAVAKTGIKVRAKAEGIYCDQLKETFTRHTGLYTSL